MGRSLSTPVLDAGVSSLASAAGFTAGDYVYQQRNGIGPVPSGALSTGAFAYNNIPSETYPLTTSTTSDLNYVEINGGTTGGQIAAKLNNGNIVLVYTKGTVGTFAQTAYFKIVDSTGATVVAETAASTATVGGRFGVSVCVLPNNNFVMCWTTQQASGNNWNLSYRVYQQDGTAVSAAITSTAINFAAQTNGAGALLKIKPRSDNSFIMMGYSNYNVYFFSATAAGFDTTFSGGTGYYLRTLRSSSQQNVDFAIRSDNTIHIFFCLTSGLVEYNVLSSAGVLTSNGTLATITIVYAISCSLMPSGNVNVFIYGNDTSTTCGILGYSWNGTAATYIGKIVSFSTTSTPDQTFLASYAQGAGGNFTLFWSHVDTSGALTYQVFNSSGVSVGGATPRVIPSISYPLGIMANPAIFDIGSETRFYLPSRLINYIGTDTSNWLNGARGAFYFSYNSTTYSVNKLATVNINYGNIGALPLGAYVKGSSTPIEASFTISSTGAYLAPVSAGTNLVGKTTVSTLTAGAVSVITLQNGNFAYCWQNSTTIYLKTYTPAGVEVSSITVATGVSSAWSFCAMAPFSNGSFVVLYMSATNTLTYKIYNSSLTQLFTGDVSTTVQVAGGTILPRVCAYGDGSQVAIAYRLSTASNYHQIKELTSANVLSTVTTGASYTNVTNLQLIPYRSNGFGFTFAEGGGITTNYSFFQIIKTGVGAWNVSGPTGMGSTTDTIDDIVFNSTIPGPANSVFSINNAGASNATFVPFLEPTFTASVIDSYYNSIAPTMPTNMRFGSGYANAIGYTGNGACVWACGNYGTGTGLLYYANVRPLNRGNNTAYFFGTQYTGFDCYSNTNFTYVAIAPMVEGSCVIAFIDGTQLPCFFIPVVQTSLISQTLTAGTDVSTSKLALTPESGFVLRGVALTTAAAGGSGLVQSKGVASVSASYPAGTAYTAFDFRCSTATGVRGSVTGRTVTMEG